MATRKSHSQLFEAGLHQKVNVSAIIPFIDDIGRVLRMTDAFGSFG